MKIASKILLLGLSAFWAYRSSELIKNLMARSPESFEGMDMVFSALIINLFFTGVFAFAGFAFPTNRLLPEGYYTIRNKEWLTKVYKRLNVETFRKGLLIVFWGKKKNRKKYFDGTRSGFANFIYQSKQSEFGHLGAFVVILIASILLLFYGYILLFVLTTAINIFGNIYPVILQRYHRMRIERIASRIASDKMRNC